jgi:hypothetical protein
LDNEPWAELADAVSAIRSQLEDAMERGQGEKVRFRTGPVEMEFAVDVRKDAEARAKVMVLPWGAEAKGGYTAGSTSRVRITLQPVDDTGDDLTINARSQSRPD